MATARERVFQTDTDRLSLQVSIGALLALTLVVGGLRLTGTTIPLRAQAAAYLVGMVALNLPHGGYEHFANLRRRTAEFRWRYVGGYLAMVAAGIGLFLLAPVVGLAVAVGVVVAKGGGGDLYVLRATTGAGHLRTRTQRLLAAAARGGAAMAVPIVAFPETFHAFSSIIVAVFDPGALGPAAQYFDVTRPLIGVGYAAVVLAHLGLGATRRDGSGSWLVDAGETLLLVCYFAVVPVVLAVGLYFPLWYSARQVARELAVQGEPGEGPDLLSGDGDASAGSVALRAWGVLIGGAMATGVVVAAVWIAAPNPLGQAGPLLGGVAFWSVAISIVALPHVVVGGVLDRRRGIWHVP
ncbi:Brp/Blh family beta-carotene 15,15'-dioxygenase [Halobaculum sp. MBLA0147]|uniref:Brp/Blh family beta-carotene 15,15'-dioxygenase n=1 Tax=Halobaculum sp. MBLA0147 TaxID=3079934 RepID=UPI0035260B34